MSDIPALVMAFLNPAQPDQLPMLFVYAGGALAISFFCSLLEATLLSVRVTEQTQSTAAWKAVLTGMVSGQPTSSCARVRTGSW